MAAENNNIKTLITDALIERPWNFEVEGRPFTLYPSTLGKSYLLSALIGQLDINPLALQFTPEIETMRLASTQRDIVSQIIAYSACKNREEIFDDYRVEEYVRFFSEECDTEDRATLLYWILFSDHVKEFIEYYGIDKEQKTMEKCQKVKKDSSSVSFCGKSPWGTLIDFACERYGWTVDYVLWGVSYTTLRMLMADSVRTVYLTDEERKKLHIALPGDEVLDANNMSAEDVMAALNLK